MALTLLKKYNKFQALVETACTGIVLDTCLPLSNFMKMSISDINVWQLTDFYFGIYNSLAM